MITDAVVTFVLGLLTSTLDLVPAFSFPDAAAAGAGTKVAGIVAPIGAIIPLGTMAAAIGAGIAFSLALSGWRVVLFIYHQFWGSS